jgi:hypothetical protein
MRGWAFRLNEKGKRGERMGRKQEKEETYELRGNPTLSSKKNSI